MSLLILGHTGMLGQVLMKVAKERGLDPIGASTAEANFLMPEKLERLLQKTRPKTVINCAAITNLAQCEGNLREAYIVNAQAVARLALGTFRLIQVSTDHYWTGDRRHRHGEYHAVRLLNEYARTKYAGERFAALAPDHLIVRTNIVGEKNMGWMIEGVKGIGITLYDDFITSPIDCRAFSEALLDVPSYRRGILNIAGREPVSKYEFGQLLADAMGGLSSAKRGSVNGMKPKRAESLGLNVDRAERLLKRALPTPADVAEALT